MAELVNASVLFSHQKVPLTQKHKEWSWYLKSEETFVPFWSYDTAPVPAEERKINKLPASGPTHAYWGKKEQTGQKRNFLVDFLPNVCLISWINWRVENFQARIEQYSMWLEFNA